MTADGRDRSAAAALHLLTVLNVLSSTLLSFSGVAKRRAPRIEALLSRFDSPRDDKNVLLRQYLR
jgi:hypothetical protein